MPLASSAPASRPRLLFPESWPVVVRTAVVLGLAILAAYHNTISAPFVFEDVTHIERSQSIRQLWPIDQVLFPASVEDSALPVSPLVNLSFAVNYAFGGVNGTSYHVTNILIHTFAAGLLFAVVRRTLELPLLRGTLGSSAAALASAIALLWALHPLHTATVTPVTQRGELLAGLFLLLTLYSFIRATGAANGWRRWSVVAVVACCAGILSKETALVAPILVLLYDRKFISGNVRSAVQRHLKLYCALAMTMILAFWLSRDVRTHDALGFTMPTGLEAWLTQCRAIATYLRLAFWPAPLVFDYGPRVTGNAVAMLPALAGCGFLLVVTLITLLRRPLVGFVFAWTVLTLLPTAVTAHLGTQPIAESRMYLPLAGVTTFAIFTGWTWLGRTGLLAGFSLAVLLAGVTLYRNRTFDTGLTLWRDTVAKAPENPRAHYHLANALVGAGRPADAVTHYEVALRLAPRYPAAHHNLGGALLQLNRARDAAVHYRAALLDNPSATDTRVNLAAALVRQGEMAEAVTHYETAARSGMLPAESQLHYGRALAEVGRIDEALVRLLEAARLNPNDAETLTITGMVLSAAGRTTEALQYFTGAVIADPGDAEARAALGDLLIESDRPAEALVHYQAALKLRPAEATLFHTSIGHALIRLGRAEEAIVHYETALQINPENADAQKSLRRVRAAVQRRGLLKN